MTDPIRKTYWKLAQWIRARRRLPEDPKALFSTIYREHLWGGEGDFDSGDGSRREEIVAPYVAAVRSYLAGLPGPVQVVDLGCGDFRVGAQLVDATDRYLACDIVPELIERNRRMFKDPRLGFEVLDAITEPLPAGGVVMLRQVLQHLNNAQVAAIVRKLSAYGTWIITEHVPAAAGFPPNRDMKTDGDIRLKTGSGLLLTEPPFDVRPTRIARLCEVRSPSYGVDAVIRTEAYGFDA